MLSSTTSQHRSNVGLKSKEGTNVQGGPFCRLGVLRLEVLFSLGRGKAFPRGAILRMHPAPFAWGGFPKPLPTTPADRPALPTDRYGPPPIPVPKHQSSLRLDWCFEIRLCQKANRSGRAAPAGAGVPKFRPSRACNPGDSPPFPAKLRPLTRPPHPAGPARR